MFFYDDYDEPKEHAYAWGMVWPRLQNYIVVDKNCLYKLRQKLSRHDLEMKALTDEERKLNFEKYIIPDPGKGDNPVNNDPLMQFVETPLPKDPPYLELVNLDLNNEEEILKFVHKNGLLGIIFDRFKLLNFKHPDYNKVNKDDHLDGDSIDEEDYLHHEKIKFIYYSSNEKEDVVRVENICGDSFWFHYGENNAVLTPITTKEINDSFFPLHAPYLPVDINYNPEAWNLMGNVAKQFGAKDHSLPYTGSWIYYYSEPLELFKKEAELLKDTFHKYNEYTIKKKEKQITPKDIRSIYGVLNNRLAHIHPRQRYVEEDCSTEFGWEVPSLLSAYYLMMFLDLHHKRKARFCNCNVCNRAFIADRDDNIYCSKRCKENTKKQRQRQRKKEK